MSRKVFTAGEVLAAADVNSFLMDQTVMSFAGTAARGSAIGTAVTGMTTYLEDTKDLRIYDGSAWSSPFGSTLVARSTFTSAAGISLNNVFTSAYNNYEVYISVGSTAVSGMNIRLRASGSDIGTNTYHWGEATLVDTTISNSAQNAVSSWALNAVRAGGQRAVTKGVFFGPARSGVTKSLLTHSMDFTGAAIVWRNGSAYNSTTSVVDGFSVRIDSGTFTGEIEVYGMRI
jgi:hypothetical protein